MNTWAGDASRFVDAMRRQFEAQSDDDLRDPMGRVWLGGGVHGDRTAVIVYRYFSERSAVGRRWEMDEMSRLFGGADVAELAIDMWLTEVQPPDGPGQVLDVDWADGLVDKSREIVWLGEPF